MKRKRAKADSTSYRVKKVLAGSTRKKKPPRGIDRSMDQSITITLQESCTSVQEMQVIGKWNSNPEEYDKIIIIIMNLGECSSLNQKRREKKKKKKKQ